MFSPRGSRRDARHQGHARLRTAVLEKRARVLERCRRVQLELEARARQAEFAELRDLCDRRGISLRVLLIPDLHTLGGRYEFAGVHDLIRDVGGASFPSNAAGVLLIEVDGDEDALEKESLKIAEFCRDRGAVQVEVAKTPEEAEKRYPERERINSSEETRTIYDAGEIHSSHQVVLGRTKET